ncbi:hypothetical protein [Escherichia coli]|uniref:hypothetical protein n=1 Tax=Escherichia coli TaxID=562 RepID=UPI001FCEF55C|nr:hypothetical protein [Escherichia coli]
MLFNIDTKSLTTSKDVFYVGISRARHEVEIFTDDKKSFGIEREPRQPENHGRRN